MYDSLTGLKVIDKSKLEGGFTDCDALLESWINSFLATRSTETDQIFLYELVKKMRELEEENKKLKNSVINKKQKIATLESKLKEALENRQTEIEEAIRNRSDIAAVSALNELENKFRKLEEISRRQQYIIRAGLSLLILLITVILNFYILWLNNNNWDQIARYQKTFVLSSIPLLVSAITLIFCGSQKSGKIFSTITAVVGLIVSIYKCF